MRRRRFSIQHQVELSRRAAKDERRRREVALLGRSEPSSGSAPANAADVPT